MGRDESMSGVCDGGKVVDIVRRLAVSVYCFSNRKKGRMDSDKNHETEVKHLRELVDCLQKENQQLKELLEQAGIKCHIEDERTVGKTIDVTFQGELRESQELAVGKMLEHDTGILSAATAFGKTVVCSKLIAERKVSTLILLESSTLIEQWVDALHDFLDIKEELPEYQTPSGRIRKRKSLIGRIHGVHDSSTGIIDIAMVGSLCKKGRLHPRLQEYGNNG